MPSWKKVIVSGSDATLNSLYAPSITGSLQGTASYAASASYVNPLVQNVFITGSLIVSASGTINDLQVGTNKLFVSASGNVGIGTTTPTEKLHVSGNGYFNGPGTTKINVISGAGVNTYIASEGGGSAFGSLTNHPTTFYQNNSEKVRIQIGRAHV